MGKFRTRRVGRRKQLKRELEKSALMLASHITYNNEQRENCKNIHRVPLQFIA